MSHHPKNQGFIGERIDNEGSNPSLSAILIFNELQRSDEAPGPKCPPPPPARLSRSRILFFSHVDSSSPALPPASPPFLFQRWNSSLSVGLIPSGTRFLPA